VGTLDVVSLFNYSTIEPFLLSKHTPVGHRIYRFLGKKFVVPFVTEFAGHTDAPFSLVSIDDHVRHGYAHTALLAEAIGHPLVHRQHGVLLAHNRVRYAGKTLSYRLEHPRGFQYTGSAERDVILLDDIVTTGITLQEAQTQLHQAGVHVLFALTLADAQN
jgi:competence protein ComFC